jgi:putative tryptophan/tyrosine transport system substrate-binding protein
MAAKSATTTIPIVSMFGEDPVGLGLNRQRGFLQGLKDTRYVEGENVAIVSRFAENQSDRLPGLAAELVRRQVTVIATLASGAMAAKSATTTIPIVSMFGDAPWGCKSKSSTPTPAATSMWPSRLL